MKTNHVLIASLFLALGAATGCDGELPSTIFPGGGGVNPPGGTIGGDNDGDDVPSAAEGDPGEAQFGGTEDNTFNHDDDLGMDGAKDPFEVLEQRQEEGPPQIRTRLHSCNKLQNQAMRNILTTFGVDIQASGDPAPAGELYRDGRDALGGANYNSRNGEALVWTNSGATKMQDIFVLAAPEIIAAMPNVEHCQVDGQGVEMFDENDECNRDAVSCLIGRSATDEHVAICNQVVQSATDVDKGKTIAVAAMLAGAYTCM